MQKVRIYQDQGADHFCVSSLIASLLQEGVDQNYSIEVVDRQFFQSSLWHQETAALIFPGGRDIPYHRALQGKPNASIRQYVENGGAYFGVCAGSYYGSALIEFEKGGPLEVLAERELQFFPGIARGPAYGNGQFCYHSSKGGLVAPLSHCESFISKKASAAYYNGGCAFIDADRYANVTVVGRYSEVEGSPPAIIYCVVGKGKALLCGVHPEYCASHPLAKDILPKDHLLALQTVEQSRRKLFSNLLKLLNLSI